MKNIVFVLKLGMLAICLSGCSFSPSSDNSNSGGGSSVSNNDGVLLYNGSSVKALNTSISGDVVVPEEFNGIKITKIESSAFKNCSQITSISIPKTVTYIEEGAFEGCIRLNSVSLPFPGRQKNATDRYTQFGCIFGRKEYTGSTAAKLVSSGLINEFWYLPSSLRTVTITDADVLGDYAFYDCQQLDTINLNESIVAIGKSCFNGCTSIETVSLPNIYTIPTNSFKNCSSLANFNIPDSVTSIGENAFAMCTNLSSINSTEEGCFVISDNVNQIETAAFKGCLKMKKISLPLIGQKQNATDMEGQFGWIFGKSSYNGSVAAPLKDPGYINEFWYVPASLKEVIITNAKRVPNNAFYDCSFLTKISINYAAQSNIGSGAFYNCVTPTWF